MTKLSLTIKADCVTSARRDVDLCTRLWAVYGRMVENKKFQGGKATAAPYSAKSSTAKVVYKEV